MAKKVAHRRGRGGSAGEVSINMTPMIDCTFLLIVFFVLTTNYTRLPKILLHRPEQSQAQHKPEESAVPNRAIISVVSKEPAQDAPDQWDPHEAANIESYRLFNKEIKPGQIGKLEAELKRRKVRAKEEGFEDFFVEVRADRRVAYMHVQEVMMAAADAGISKMNITAKASENR